MTKSCRFCNKKYLILIISINRLLIFSFIYLYFLQIYQQIILDEVWHNQCMVQLKARIKQFVIVK